MQYIKKNSMPKKMGSLFVSTAVVLAVSGCGGGPSDRPAVYPASGKVLYNGSPVAGATVAFWGEGAPQAALGKTNDQGEFTLTTFDSGDGAVAGEHTITVIKADGSGNGSASGPIEYDAASGDASEAYDAMMKAAANPASDSADASLLPEKYAKQDTTTLRETVSPEGPNEFTLELTD